MLLLMLSLPPLRRCCAVFAMPVVPSLMPPSPPSLSPFVASVAAAMCAAAGCVQLLHVLLCAPCTLVMRSRTRYTFGIRSLHVRCTLAIVAAVAAAVVAFVAAAMSLPCGHVALLPSCVCSCTLVAACTLHVRYTSAVRSLCVRYTFAAMSTRTSPPGAR